MIKLFIFWNNFVFDHITKNILLFTREMGLNSNVTFQNTLRQQYSINMIIDNVISEYNGSKIKKKNI